MVTDANDHLGVAKKTLRVEAQGILDAMEGLGDSFSRAVDTLLSISGKVVLTGAGKSGHIARKIAATLASTGTPSFFLHPSDAGHGDMGMVSDSDAILAISHSGESQELANVLDHCRRIKVSFVLLTGKTSSTLARESDITVQVVVGEEACPLDLAPTSSTTATLAVGDAIAMALLTARGFTPYDFAKTHPEGSLGRSLLTKVSDLMATGDAVPMVGPDATVAEAIVVMSEKRLGMTLVDGDAGPGILTDGDLRRCLERGADIHEVKVSDVMSSKAHSIGVDRLATEALQKMEEHKITHLAVVAKGRLVGVIDIHGLMQGRIA